MIHRLLHNILTWVVGAILLVLLLGSICVGGHPLIPGPVGNVFVTSSDLFSQFLSFSIPLIIIGLVTPAIADLGHRVGKRLGITTTLAYASTLFAGFLTFVACTVTFPRLFAGTSLADASKSGGALSSYFTVEMPPAVEVMTALLLSFVLDIDLSMVPRGVLHKGFIELRTIITRFIERLIIPLLPLHIFDIFLNLAYTKAVSAVMKALLRVIIIVLTPEVVVLSIQLLTAGLTGRRDLIKVLLATLPAYPIALGTSSSAATIPTILRRARKNGASDVVTSFAIPLCATIHLMGPTSKIFSLAFVIALTQGLYVSTTRWIGFIFMLNITMVIAPGVFRGTIMAAAGLLSSMFGFNDQQVAFMVAAYITPDSFGATTNVTGDDAIATIVDRMVDGPISDEGDPENVRELSFDGMTHLHAVSVEGVVSPRELETSAAAARSDEQSRYIVRIGR